MCVIKHMYNYLYAYILSTHTLSSQIDKLVTEMESRSDSGLSSLTEVLDDETKVQNNSHCHTTVGL